MKTAQGKLPKTLLAVALTGSALAYFCPVVQADTSQTTNLSETITGGSLSIQVPTTVSFPPTNLNGNQQKIQATFPSVMTLIDATGTGSGWHVTAEASQFTCTSLSNQVLPEDSLMLDTTQAPTITPGTGSGASPTFVPVSSPLLDTGSAVSLFSAAVGTGMGNYAASFPNNVLNLTLNPGTTYASSSGSEYTSTITWTIISGP